MIKVLLTFILKTIIKKVINQNNDIYDKSNKHIEQNKYEINSI